MGSAESATAARTRTMINAETVELVIRNSFMTTREFGLKNTAVASGSRSRETSVSCQHARILTNSATTNSRTPSNSFMTTRLLFLYLELKRIEFCVAHREPQTDGFTSQRTDVARPVPGRHFADLLKGRRCVRSEAYENLAETAPVHHRCELALNRNCAWACGPASLRPSGSASPRRHSDYTGRPLSPGVTASGRCDRVLVGQQSLGRIGQVLRLSGRE